MIFIALTFIAALLIEGLGTATSVIGLSALFGANPIIISLAIALDMGKIVVVSLLYKYWSTLGKIMKSYALIAAFITMVITSAGAGGYLMGEFQKAIIGSQEGSLRVDALKQEQQKLEARKKQIDDQIAAIPEKYSASQRIRLMNQFKAEQKQATDRLTEIDKELPTLQVNQLSVEAKAGPILTIAKSFDIPVEQAIKYVILMIIFVFDPLAVFLIIAGNFLIEQRKKTLETSKDPEPDDDIRVPRREDAIIDHTPNSQTKAAMDEAREIIARITNPAPVEPPITKAQVEDLLEQFDPVKHGGEVPPPPEKKVYDDMYPRIVDLATPVVPEANEPTTVVESTPPIFEVLQPSPDVETEPAPMPVTATQTPTPASHTSEITLNDLTAPNEITMSSLKPGKSSAFDDVPEAGSEVTFVEPHPSGARTVYQGQRR